VRAECAEFRAMGRKVTITGQANQISVILLKGILRTVIALWNIIFEMSIDMSFHRVHSDQRFVMPWL